MDDPTPNLRLFVALAVADEVRSELAKLQRDLRRALGDPPSLRWTRPEQIHLTLRFLGEVAADQLDELTRRLNDQCVPFGPVRLRAEALGCFPDLRRPRVLWAGLRDETGHLLDLQRAVEHAVGPLAAKRADERFHGHLTLARCRFGGPSLGAGLDAAIASAVGRAYGGWTARTVDLMRSELSPGGSRHTVVARIPLTGAAVPPTTSRL